MLRRHANFSFWVTQMTNRSANESIKGYSYQFDRTVVEILECNDPDVEFVVEGVEDVDVLQVDLSTFVQCKYYEGTDYNHSVIKPAVIAMLRHFHALRPPEAALVRYKLYGHFKSGQEKLAPDFSLGFFKKHFLSYKKDKVTHNVHDELELTDDQLQLFQQSLDIDLNARTYDDQRAHITTKLLVEQIPSCASMNDAELFFYPSAATAVQSLAIQSDISKRQISKAEFIKEISKKDVVFNHWLRASFDSDKYAKVVKKNHFSSGLQTPKAVRVFALEVPPAFDLGEMSELLTKLAKTFSHKERVRTPDTDRFCPYVLLRKVSEDNLIAIKERLYSEGLMFDDGHPFRGSKLSLQQLARFPTKENLYQLKFLSLETEIPDVFNLIEGASKKVYDFYIGSRMSAECIPNASIYNPISTEDPFFITKIFK